MVITLQKLQSFNKSDLDQILESGSKEEIENFLFEWGLEIRNGQVKPKEEYSRVWMEVYGFYDKAQSVRKVGLNSAYGALLNAGSRFFDQRLGQSTTLTGRSINRHQASKINEVITGEYREYGDSQIYCDTDSVYFTAYPTLKSEIKSGNIPWDKDTVIALYDSFVPIINGSFPEFLKKQFNVPESRSDGVIKCGREIVAESGIWMVKKRYACLMIDKDGRRYDVDGKPGKVKAMGLDLKRADTPKFMQQFLSEILLDTLTGLGESAIIEKIREFKKRFEGMKPWQQGTPRSVNKLSHYRDKLEEYGTKKAQGYEVAAPSVPGHVSASLAWNRMREIHRDRHSMKITDGMRIIVCKLKLTPENNLTSIAYPVDETRLPEWFVNLPFDSEVMMEGIVDKKIENLLGVLKWDLSKSSAEHEHLATLFDFSAI